MKDSTMAKRKEKKSYKSYTQNEDVVREPAL
jgi:hypothetical protein